VCAQVYPCDTPVVIAYVDNEGEEEELIPVSEEDLPRLYMRERERGEGERGGGGRERERVGV
jgi:hypothetical protein